MLRTAVLVSLALAGFAANSLLCRLALTATSISPGQFTAWRLASGALVLGVIVLARQRARDLHAGDWRGACALFVYAIAFAQAYVALDAGVGALLLFGAVQITMLVAARLRGERFAARQWLGLTAAALGLAAMKLPVGPVALPWSSTTAMLLAGVAWGVYSLLGRGAVAPLRHTAGNFLRAAPLAVLFALSEPLFARTDPTFAWTGVGYAVASGALASGLGYALWYAALPRLLASQAALLQLLVPLLAALGGVMLLSERIDARLVLGGAAILGGVALALRRGR